MNERPVVTKQKENDVIAIYEQGYTRGYEDAIKEYRDRSFESYKEGYKSGVRVGKVLGYNDGFQDSKCEECPYALLDYETYYGTTQKQYFVEGCKKNKSPENCKR